jgi:hypothetical protein
MVQFGNTSGKSQSRNGRYHDCDITASQLLELDRRQREKLIDERDADWLHSAVSNPFWAEETEGTEEDRREQNETESPLERVSEPILLSSASSVLFCPSSVPLTEEQFWTKVCELVRASPLPPAAGRFYLPALKSLVALCAAAQSLTGELPFLLTCRRAGSLLGIGHTKAWQLLMALVRAGVLEIAKHGDSKRANRYRYVVNRKES